MKFNKSKFGNCDYGLIYRYTNNGYIFDSYIKVNETNDAVIKESMAEVLKKCNFSLALNEMIVVNDLLVGDVPKYVGVSVDNTDKTNAHFDYVVLEEAKEVKSKAKEEPIDMFEVICNILILSFNMSYEMWHVIYKHLISEGYDKGNKLEKKINLLKKKHNQIANKTHIGNIYYLISARFYQTLAVLLNDFGEINKQPFLEFLQACSPYVYEAFTNAKINKHKSVDVIGSIVRERYSIQKYNKDCIATRLMSVITGIEATSDNEVDSEDYYGALLDVFRDAVNLFSVYSDYEDFLFRYFGVEKSTEIGVKHVEEFLKIPLIKELFNLKTYGSDDLVDVFDMFYDEPMVDAIEIFDFIQSFCEEENSRMNILEYYSISALHRPFINTDGGFVAMDLLDLMQLILVVAIRNSTYTGFPTDLLKDWLYHKFEIENGTYNNVVKAEFEAHIKQQQKKIQDCLESCLRYFIDTKLIAVYNMELADRYSDNINVSFEQLKQQQEDNARLRGELRELSQKKSLLSEANETIYKVEKDVKALNEEVEKLNNELSMKDARIDELLKLLQSTQDELKSEGFNKDKAIAELSSITFANCGGRDTLIADLKKILNMPKEVTKTSTASIKCDCIIIFTDYLDHATFNACMSFAEKRIIPFMYVSKATNTELVIEQIYNNAKRMQLI